jgi:hypothetical protein
MLDLPEKDINGWSLLRIYKAGHLKFVKTNP